MRRVQSKDFFENYKKLRGGVLVKLSIGIKAFRRVALTCFYTKMALYIWDGEMAEEYSDEELDKFQRIRNIIL
ncbi:Uncharacterised protein [uncultured archaeon]|nr:Uncharacterised protein [uncultured archaeon]